MLGLVGSWDDGSWGVVEGGEGGETGVCSFGMVLMVEERDEGYCFCLLEQNKRGTRELVPRGGSLGDQVTILEHDVRTENEVVHRIGMAR